MEIAFPCTTSTLYLSISYICALLPPSTFIYEDLKVLRIESCFLGPDYLFDSKFMLRLLIEYSYRAGNAIVLGPT